MCVCVCVGLGLGGSGYSRPQLQMLPTVPSGPLSPGTASNTYDTPSRVASRRNTLSPQTVPPAGLGAAGASQDGAPPAPLLLPEEPGVLPGWAVQPPALLQVDTHTHTHTHTLTHTHTHVLTFATQSSVVLDRRTCQCLYM